MLLTWSKPAYALFFDVAEDHPYTDAIQALTAAGVLQGYENRSFQPEREINRAEFTKMLTSIIFPEDYIASCMDDLPESDAVIPNMNFPDVPESAWFAPYICAAWANGIVSGYPDGLFRPEEGVKFVEAAKMLSLAFGLTGTELPNFGVLNVVWYQPYVEFLASQNAIPYSITDLIHNVNRGEVAEMIYRLHGYPIADPIVPQRLSKPTESVTYPVDWKTYSNDDYTVQFAYTNLWPEPYVLPKGHYDGRIPYYRSSWVIYFGPEGDSKCAGTAKCVGRDMWIEGFPLEDSERILDIIQRDEFFVQIEDQTIINGLPTMIILEDIKDCLDKRSFHFGEHWIYSVNMRCAGQDQKLYHYFEEMVKSVKELDERPLEHRK